MRLTRVTTECSIRLGAALCGTILRSDDEMKVKPNKLSEYYTEAACKLQQASDSLKRSASIMRKCSNERSEKSK